MGSGKTSAAIEYINAHPGDKFIYITPYLSEAARIRDACPDAAFVEPSNKIPAYQFKKYLHTLSLIQSGRNIATTHSAFKYYTDETLRAIREHQYTLIVDESITILEKFQYKSADIRLLSEAGYLDGNTGVYDLLREDYRDGALSEMFRLFLSRKLVKSCDSYYWSLPAKFFMVFRDVLVLTYMFSGQSICYLFQSMHIPYKYIGVLCDAGRYLFSDTPCRAPPYVYELSNRIHIVGSDKLNEVGKHKCALSMSWFSKNSDGVEQLRKHMQNIVQNIWRDIPAERKLWGSYKIGQTKLKGKGYTKLFLPFNARATNDYRDRDHLIYAANVFMNVGEKQFYESRGVTVDEDTYALSVMVQWIWRSAIRDGGEIWVYIPSSRMRTLFQNWIDTVSKGGIYGQQGTIS